MRRRLALVVALVAVGFTAACTATPTSPDVPVTRPNAEVPRVIEMMPDSTIANSTPAN